MSNPTPVRLALIGAGVFARDAHLPAILREPDAWTLAAVYSRTRRTAQALADTIPYAVDVTTDLDDLMARDDIDAVDIVLPIAAMPPVIAQALAAGKHVLSEKPIAPNVATGRALLAQYAHQSLAAAQAGKQPLVWMVGENWRYEENFRHAADTVRRGEIGAPVMCTWSIHSPMTPDNKYYHTAWRRDSSIPGGLVLDGGVHHMAILRMILGEVVEVSAIARQVDPALQPIDTLVATLRFASGALATYQVTYAASAPWPPALYISGTKSTLLVMRNHMELTRGGETKQMFARGYNGVERELQAFWGSVRTGFPHNNTPQEALADLAVMEAMLVSAATGRPVKPAQL